MLVQPYFDFCSWRIKLSLTMFLRAPFLFCLLWR